MTRSHFSFALITAHEMGPAPASGRYPPRVLSRSHFFWRPQHPEVIGDTPHYCGHSNTYSKLLLIIDRNKQTRAEGEQANKKFTMPSSERHLREMSSPGQSYFDVEGDKLNRRRPNCASGADVNDDDEDDHIALLTWRGDPSETHSDWSIVVVTNELQSSTYHVHKSVMCFGPRQSKFFARIMLNNGLKKKASCVASSKKDNKNHSDDNVSSMINNEQQNAHTTKVELDQKDADNFPILLDYIYAPSVQMSRNDGTNTVLTAASTFTTAYSLFTVPTGGSEDEDHSSCATGDAPSAVVDEIPFITSKNSVSLRFLARHFEVDAFMLAVNRFIQRDLSFKTGPAYLTRGWEYKDDRLVQSAQRLCAENFEQLDRRALMKLPLNLFRIVTKSLESFDEDKRDRSHALSDVVCEYMEKNPDRVSAELLIELTDPLRMPYIAAEAAIGFTALVKELDSQDAARHWDGLVGLCRRCAKSVVQEFGWNDFCVDAAVDEYLGNSTGHKRASRVDSLLFATSFASALEQAQDDYAEITLEQERLEGTVEALSSTISLMEEIGSRRDQHMVRQQKAIEEAKKQILDLKRQIKQFKEQNNRRNHPPHPPPAPRSGSKQKQNVPPPAVPSSTPTKLDLTPEEIVRDLVSPSEVVGAVMAARRGRKPKDLRSKEEMRARSLMEGEDSLC